MTHTRLPRIAGTLYILAIASMVLLPILILTALLLPGNLNMSTPNYADLPQGTWPFSVWLGIAVALIPTVFTLLALNAMRRLFALYRLGDPLAPQAGPLIQSIGMNLLIAAGLSVALSPVRTVLITWSNPPGHRAIALGLSSGDIGFILVAGLLLLIGWSMSEATKIAAENREFV